MSENRFILREDCASGVRMCAECGCGRKLVEEIQNKADVLFKDPSYEYFYVNIDAKDNEIGSDITVKFRRDQFEDTSKSTRTEQIQLGQWTRLDKISEDSIDYLLGDYNVGIWVNCLCVRLNDDDEELNTEHITSETLTRAHTILMGSITHRGLTFEYTRNSMPNELKVSAIDCDFTDKQASRWYLTPIPQEVNGEM